MSAEPIPAVVRFGDFELDLRSRELRRGRLRLNLETKPFQILELLVENSDRLVTRKELREKLWPDSFVEFDRGIYTAMNRLRKALGDTMESPRYIQTRSGLGYRFVAPLTPALVRTRLLPWGVEPDARAQSNPGFITAGAQQLHPAVPLVNSGFDGPGLRFQLPRGDWDLAELRLRLTKTEEGAVNLRIEFSGVRPDSAPPVSSRRRPSPEYAVRRRL
jgi:DNA-binding winged helix-turn-helix (wHTH) protein